MPNTVSAQTARDLQNQGHELYKSGNYTAALSKLEASLRLSDYYYAHYLKYLCHEKLDQEDEAPQVSTGRLNWLPRISSFATSGRCIGRCTSVIFRQIRITATSSNRIPVMKMPCSVALDVGSA